MKMKSRKSILVLVAFILALSMAFLPMASAAIEIDGSGCGATGTGTGLACSISYVGDTRIIITITTDSQDAVNVSGVTVAGDAATPFFTGLVYSIYRATANPSASVVVSFSGSTPHGSAIFVRSFTGVNSPDFYQDDGGPTGGTTSTTPFTISTGTIAAGATGRRVIQIVGAECNCSTISVSSFGTSQTQLFINSITTSSVNLIAASYRDIDGSVVMDTTLAHEAGHSMAYGTVWFALIPEFTTTTTTSTSTVVNYTSTSVQTVVSTIIYTTSLTTTTSTTVVATSHVTSVSVSTTVTSTTNSATTIHATTTGSLLSSPDFVPNLVIIGLLLVAIPFLVSIFTGLLGFTAAEIVMTLVGYFGGMIPWPFAAANIFITLAVLLLANDSSNQDNVGVV